VSKRESQRYDSHEDACYRKSANSRPAWAKSEAKVDGRQAAVPRPIRGVLIRLAYGHTTLDFMCFDSYREPQPSLLSPTIWHDCKASLLASRDSRDARAGAPAPPSRGLISQ